MNTFYLDHNFRIHFGQNEAGTLLPWEDESGVFDGKCESYVRGFRVVPDGCTWMRQDGAVFTGLMISPAVDFADLDGNLLITNDLFKGMEVIDGKITLSDAPGIGIHRINL